MWVDGGHIGPGQAGIPTEGPEKLGNEALAAEPLPTEGDPSTTIRRWVPSTLLVIPMGPCSYMVDIWVLK